MAVSTELPKAPSVVFPHRISGRLQHAEEYIRLLSYQAMGLECIALTPYYVLIKLDTHNRHVERAGSSLKKKKLEIAYGNRTKRKGPF